MSLIGSRITVGQNGRVQPRGRPRVAQSQITVERMTRMKATLKTEYRKGDKVWIKGGAHLYRVLIHAFAGEAEASEFKGPELLTRLQATKHLLILHAVSYPGVITRKHTMSGGNKNGKLLPDFTAYWAEMAMERTNQKFITTAEWLEARERH